ncbi:hypothetical protein C7M84_006083 [Penaeus vannamei]|uniref:Uncharacterized protein n=1 Tax=Penaeus vannamei TaxID=6689 RepID=A0A3R7P4S2_PENVA|nr:uncharacterized protein LOC113807083 [Penaeus vannamei]ROT75380.1 hypothetical protein C7M84_006083 [Penaeus vannamei]
MSSFAYIMDDVSNGLKTFSSDVSTLFGGFDLTVIAVIALVVLLAVISYDVIMFLLFFSESGRSLQLAHELPGVEGLGLQERGGHQPRELHQCKVSCCDQPHHLRHPISYREIRIVIGLTATHDVIILYDG